LAPSLFGEFSTEIPYLTFKNGALLLSFAGRISFSLGFFI